MHVISCAYYLLSVTFSFTESLTFLSISRRLIKNSILTGTPSANPARMVCDRPFFPFSHVNSVIHSELLKCGAFAERGSHTHTHTHNQPFQRSLNLFLAHTLPEHTNTGKTSHDARDIEIIEPLAAAHVNQRRWSTRFRQAIQLN